jgi:hypothetical protein
MDTLHEDIYGFRRVSRTQPIKYVSERKRFEQKL